VKAELGGQGIEWRPSLRQLLEPWLEDGLGRGGRRRTSDAVAGGLGESNNGFSLALGAVVVEANGEESRGEVEAEEQESGALWQGAPLKPHEAVTEGGRNSGWKTSETVGETVGRQGGRV
jgi:hypothetical protein